MATITRAEARMESVDVPECVRNMAELLQGSIGPGIQINTHFPLRSCPLLTMSSSLDRSPRPKRHGRKELRGSCVCW
jgi:hypothetical protein